MAINNKRPKLESEMTAIKFIGIKLQPKKLKHKKKVGLIKKFQHL
jgi:hypothetical protein